MSTIAPVLQAILRVI